MSYGVLLSSPNGFSMVFFKDCWGVVKGGILNAVEDFFNLCFLDKGSHATITFLIPKKEGAVLINGYWPIRLIISSYKIISKILADWLKVVLDSLISHNHVRSLVEDKAWMGC